MRQQIVTAPPGNAVAAASKRNIRHLAYAFTEHGALMAANILNSPRAVAMSVEVSSVPSPGILHSALYLLHSLAPPPQPPKPEIGFLVKEDPIPYRTRKRA